MKNPYNIDGPYRMTRRQRVGLARSILVMLLLTIAVIVIIGLNYTLKVEALEAAPMIVKTVDLRPPEPESLGEFKITHYCPCKICCGKTDGITCTGTQATAGRTVAVDPRVIPYGTEILIDGHVYVAEDSGGFRGKQIDIFCKTHEEAIVLGTGVKEVYINAKE